MKAYYSLDELGWMLGLGKKEMRRRGVKAGDKPRTQSVDWNVFRSLAFQHIEVVACPIPRDGVRLSSLMGSKLSERLFSSIVYHLGVRWLRVLVQGAVTGFDAAPPHAATIYVDMQDRVVDIEMWP